MSTKNRSDRIQQLHKVVSKHFQPIAAPDDRSVLEHLLYACCLEDAGYEAADEAFHRVQEVSVDWNEVRVATVTELSETLHNLPRPAEAAMRLKKCLQAMFETRYSFDLDDMYKLNQGKAVQELESWNGMTKFVLNYVIQNALGGHAIPVSKTILSVLLLTEVVSETEASKWQAPGLERAVPKAKGPPFFSCLHQLAIAYADDPKNPEVIGILNEAGAHVAPPADRSGKPQAKKAATKKKTASKSSAAKKSASKASSSVKSAKKTVKKAKKATTKTSTTKRKPK